MGDESQVVNYDLVLEEFGGFGRFQWFMYILACVGAFHSGFFVVTPLFGSKVLPHRCRVPDCDVTEGSFVEDFLNFTIPQNSKTEKWEQCRKFVRLVEFNSSSGNFSCKPEAFDHHDEEECDEWVYDTTQFVSTTVSEFDLTCDRAWMSSLEMSCIMAGYLSGSLSLGLLSDKFGRKIGLVFSAFAISISGVAASFSPNLYTFLPLRFIGGVGSMGSFQIAFIAAIEYIGPKWRTLSCILLNVPFTFGEATLGLVAYFIRAWRNLLLITSLPVMIMISYYWIMPESLRWLMTKNRRAEAVIILRRIAKVNKRKFPPELEEQIHADNSLIEGNKEVEKKSALNLLRSSIIRKWTVILSYCWMVCSLMYYGLSSYVGSFSGNLFLNFTLVVLIEIPGYVTSAVASNFFGRKIILVISFLIGGATCITAAFLPSEFETLIVALSLAGKFCITAAFGAIFVYTGELYPTENRAVGLGTCSMHSRIGGIIAPFIANLAYTYKPLPSMIFGILSFVAGLLIFLLPETMGQALPQTIKDSEMMGRSNCKWKFRSKERSIEA